MIRVKTNLGFTNIVEKATELPSFVGVHQLYMDGETTHFDKNGDRKGKDRNGAFRPYQGDRLCGVAVLRDDEPEATYVPIRHTDKSINIPMEHVRPWLKEAVTLPNEWINHNVKFDAHFCAQDGAEFQCELTDTLTEAKMHDSERFGHGLKDLVPAWCGVPMDEVDAVKAFLEGAKTTDYARVPYDILGPYAGDDVIGNRHLHQYLLANKPEQIEDVWETERKLTQVLFDMERRGLRIDKGECQRELLLSLKKLILSAEELESLTGKEYIDSPNHLFDLFIVQLGLPILSYTTRWDKETRKKVVSTSPSFDKDALALYSIHPQVLHNEQAKKTVELVQQFRKESTFKSLFLETYLDRADDNGYIHPSYNQLVRTGRMSSSGPNSQQLNKRAKKLIHPDEGEAFKDYDASQIEFRIIVHYINDLSAIQAYREDEKTDFHNWVSELCQIHRDPAKNVNFAMAFGAGKRRVLNMLRNDPSVMAEVGAMVREMIECGKIPERSSNKEYLHLCMEKSKEIYQIYHERLPGIKRCSAKATKSCSRRGFSFNAYGRRRHLGSSGAYKAFNTVVQGTAMDYIKTRMVALSPRWNSWTRENGIELRANVHDAILFSGLIETMRNEDVGREILRVLQVQEPVVFKVPFFWNGGFSTETWADAG